MRHNYIPAETYVDNVVRKLDFLAEHPDWKIWCENYRWRAERGDQHLEDDDLGMLMDRLEVQA
jgi:hypothetical protein